MKRRNEGSLADDLTRLPSRDRSELTAMWRLAYGEEAPSNISQPLLLRALAYRLQAQALGGIKPATHRYLTQVVRDTTIGKATPPAVASIKPGTRFLREWHGITYEVIVQSDGNGVLLNGEPVRSLTAAAKKITGVKWSGPAFFGLRSSKQGQAV